MAKFKVGYMVGSLAKNSINRKLAKALVKLAPEELDMSEIEFREAGGETLLGVDVRG